MCRLGPAGAVFEAFGAVRASPMACARLMKRRDALLLFPGGAREVRPFIRLSAGPPQPPESLIRSPLPFSRNIPCATIGGGPA